ncbi:MAG: DUF452 family protein [Muribaculaceae bacterium]|nr:DUF452 family protein [Muribaculaceae bacterium]
MKVEFITRENADRLIIVFAGWAMDPRPFKGLRRDGYDIALVWDYNSMHIDWSFAGAYSEICIIAWSLGVYASAISTYAIDSRVTRRVAINGTLYPVDRRRGIPENIFRGTLEGLNERNLLKFYRRMAGSRERFELFAANMPQRQVDELKTELEAFYPLPLLAHEPLKRWDMAIIGRDDAIFPAVNQWRAWQGTPIEILDEPHLIDIRKIIDHYIVDKERMSSRFARQQDTYDDNTPVQANIVERLCNMAEARGIDKYAGMRGARVLEIGCGTGLLSRHINQWCDCETSFEMWDIAGKAPLQGPQRIFRQTDAETSIMRIPSSSVDIIASSSTIQWFNSPTRFFVECSRILASGGYLIASTFVKGNLYEVAQATGRSLPLLSARQWSEIIPDTFDVIDWYSYSYTLEFDSAIEVFRHLKGSGVNSLDRDSAGDSHIRNALAHYGADLDGKYRATYRPLLFILRKK